MDLKLLAFDAEDLCVMSAHLQDAALIASDMAWQPKERRFALVCQRRDHVGGGADRACGLHFNFVTAAQRLRMPQGEAAPLKLIGLGFEAGETPSGFVTLLFDGGAAVRLSVECIDASMRDLVPASQD
ncbi:DUF2948 family protein [Terrarubrum flagellatum]|uniref:DUF2948 family protein n=1 Tax=Terrirubrum flagellatum TaxID=2895980 RepID=UPI003144F1FB